MIVFSYLYKIGSCIVHHVPILEHFVKYFQKYAFFRYIVGFALSTALSITVCLTFIDYKTKHDRKIMDHVKNSEKIAQIRNELETIFTEICDLAGFADHTKCPILIRSFSFHYNTSSQQFMSGAWCMGQLDMLSDPNYLKRREILMSDACKEFLMSPHDGMLSKKALAQHCPFLVDNCLFKSKNKYPSYAVMSCINDEQHQGVSCFAVLDGENIEAYKMSVSDLPINELLRQRLHNGNLSYFGD